MMQKNPANILSAFTLIELSISLVIIGLIVGGILGARDLIRQAELRSIVSDIQGYKAVANTFLLKYEGLPGDLRNAKSYWPSCTDSSPNMCNGDGDSLIEFQDTVTSSLVREDGRSWEHLSLSGMIPGSYRNNLVPIGADGETAYVFTYGGSHGRFGNLFRVDGRSSGLAPSMTPEEVKSIDDKIDDGVYNSGHMHVRNGTGTTDCYDGNGYNLSLTTVVCIPIFFFD